MMLNIIALNINELRKVVRLYGIRVNISGNVKELMRRI